MCIRDRLYSISLMPAVIVELSRSAAPLGSSERFLLFSRFFCWLICVVVATDGVHPPSLDTTVVCINCYTVCCLYCMDSMDTVPPHELLLRLAQRSYAQSIDDSFSFANLRCRPSAIAYSTTADPCLSSRSLGGGLSNYALPPHCSSVPPGSTPLDRVN